MIKEDNYEGLIELVDIIKESDPEGKVVKLSKEDLEIVEKLRKKNIDIQEENTPNESKDENDTEEEKENENLVDIQRKKSIFRKLMDFFKGV